MLKRQSLALFGVLGYLFFRSLQPASSETQGLLLGTVQYFRAKVYLKGRNFRPKISHHPDWQPLGLRGCPSCKQAPEMATMQVKTNARTCQRFCYFFLLFPTMKPLRGLTLRPVARPWSSQTVVEQERVRKTKKHGRLQ